MGLSVTCCSSSKEPELSRKARKECQPKAAAERPSGLPSSCGKLHRLGDVAGIHLLCGLGGLYGWFRAGLRIAAPWPLTRAALWPKLVKQQEPERITA